MLCEERGRMWSDAVAAGEVTVTGDACNGEVTDVRLTRPGLAAKYRGSMCEGFQGLRRCKQTSQ